MDLLGLGAFLHHAEVVLLHLMICPIKRIVNTARCSNEIFIAKIHY